MAADRQFESVRVNYRQRNGMYVISAPEFSNIVVIGKSWPIVRELCDELMEVVIPHAPPKGKKETPE